MIFWHRSKKRSILTYFQEIIPTGMSLTGMFAPVKHFGEHRDEQCPERQDKNDQDRNIEGEMFQLGLEMIFFLFCPVNARISFFHQ
jgi:hypothetical protein